VGFDAANDICPNETYVRLACGLDYREAAPVSGVRFGPGIESLAVEVNVEQ
jgi:transglutaminase-like putative cysteine protease